MSTGSVTKAGGNNQNTLFTGEHSSNTQIPAANHVTTS